MDNWPNPIDTLRHHVKTGERRRFEKDRQTILQMEAVRRQEAQAQEKADYLASLEMEQPVSSQPEERRLSHAEEAHARSTTGRIKGRADRPQTQNALTGKIFRKKTPKPLSRVAAIRGQLKATQPKEKL